MKHIRITLTVFTLAAILAVSGGCSHKSTSVNSDSDKIENSSTITGPAEDVKRTVIAPATKEASSPSNINNLYPAYQYINGKKQYGFIDQKGTFIIQPGYSSVTDFSDGYAVITGSKDYKVIDKHGIIMYERKNYVSSYSNGGAVFSEDYSKYGYLDTNGKVMLKPVYYRADNFRKDNTAFVLLSNRTYALINKKGTIIGKYQLDKKYDDVIKFKDGYIIYKDDQTNKEGVINYKGEEIYKPEYNSITYLGDDLFAINDPALSETSVLDPSALYDNKGNQLTDYILYDLSSFHDGYTSATNSQYTYLIDTTGKEAADLPKAEGRGTMTLMGNVIKAEIDDDLIYMTKDGTVIWQNDRTHYLSSDSTDITVKELKFKPNKFAYVYYPYIEGIPDSIQASVNGKLYKLFTENRADLKESGGLSVTDTFDAELIKNLLIINKKGYDYYFNTPHGVPVKATYNIDMKTGEFYDLSDLFKKKSNYEAKVNKIIGDMYEKHIKEEDLNYTPPSFKGIKENQFFKITKDALVIYFSPYELAGYARDYPEFKIPFDQLKDVIDYDGSLWNSFRDNETSQTNSN
jgi:hypothetical protein